VRGDPSASHTQPIALHVAASLVHQQLSPGSMSDNAGEALERTALALSHLVDIFYVDAQGRMKRIPDSELAAGRFENAAKQFRSAGGTVYQSLSMRRRDMAEAISILRNARAGAASQGRPQSHTEEA
jgi:hypothetical protein